MKTTKQKSFRQETRLAARYGGAVTPGSGNGWTKKNDVRTPDLSIEAKYTDAKQFSLKQADLHTAERHALIDGRDSVFIISFAGEEWAVIREEDFQDLRSLKNGQRVALTQLQALGYSRTIPPDEPTEDPTQPMLPGADRW